MGGSLVVLVLVALRDKLIYFHFLSVRVTGAKQSRLISLFHIDFGTRTWVVSSLARTNCQEKINNRPLDTYKVALANISCQAWLMTLFVGEMEWRNDACFEQEGRGCRQGTKGTQASNFEPFGSSLFLLYPIFRCTFSWTYWCSCAPFCR